VGGRGGRGGDEERTRRASNGKFHSFTGPKTLGKIVKGHNDPGLQNVRGQCTSSSARVKSKGGGSQKWHPENSVRAVQAAGTPAGDVSRSQNVEGEGAKEALA